MDLAALKTEIALPKYAGMGDEQIADELNKPTAQVNRGALDSGELATCLTLSEYVGLPPAQRQYVDMLVSAGSVPLTQNVKTQLQTIFIDGSQTRANFTALQKRTGTRAEELGLGRVTTSDVADARRS